jgi:hypothetical protein
MAPEDAASAEDTVESESAALTAAAAYTITASVDPISSTTPTVLGGTINPIGSTSYANGSSVTYNIVPNSNSGSYEPGFDILSVTVDGVNRGAITSYTFSNLNANHTIRAKFKTHAASSYVIKSLATTGGSINPSGATTVNAGASRSYSITPASGYVIADVVVDGVSKGAVSSFTFTGVNAYHFIRASFRQQSTFQAEQAAREGGAVVRSSWQGYHGSGYVEGYLNSTTAKTTFTTQILGSYGTYKVTLRYSAGNGTSTNTGLYVNGTKIKNITATGTGSWSTWRDQVEYVTLRGGTNTIAYKAETASGACINLDELTVAPSIGPYTPSISQTLCDGYLYLSGSEGGQPYSNDSFTYQWYLNGVALTDFYYGCQGSNSSNLTTYLTGMQGNYTFETISNLTGLSTKSANFRKWECP